MIEIIRIITFLAFSVPCWICILFIQIPGIILKKVNRKFYRILMRFTIHLFACYLVAVTSILSPLKIVVTGDYEMLNQNSFVPIMSNHQVFIKIT